MEARMKKRSAIVLALAWAGASTLAAAQEPATTAPPKPEATPRPAEAAPAPTLWPASELKWTDLAAVKGAKEAVLWGDPKKEGFGKLNRWPAGGEVPLHFHPFESRGVVLEGTMTITPEGGAAKELGPGSYWHLPGRVKHVTTCKPGAECVFLTTSRMRHETRMAPAPK
jgi:quercetin dioxygenase-like cupin family protein